MPVKWLSLKHVCVRAQEIACALLAMHLCMGPGALSSARRTTYLGGRLVVRFRVGSVPHSATLLMLLQCSDQCLPRCLAKLAVSPYLAASLGFITLLLIAVRWCNLLSDEFMATS